MQTNKKTRSLDEIELARAFAILAVLAVHASSSGVVSVPPDSFLFPVYNFFNIAGKLGTPTFIMLSSFVLFYNYYPRDLNAGIVKRFYKKRLKFILIPYIVFSALYFGLKWFVYYDYPSYGFALEKFLSQLALGKAHPHLYFVFISVQLYILFPLLLLMFKKYAFLRRNALWIGLVLQWTWVILNKNYFHITLKGSISLSYLSFYFVGAFLGVYYHHIRERMRDGSYKDKVLMPIFIGYGVMVTLYTTYMYTVRVNAYPQIAENLPQLATSYLGEFAWATHALLAGLVLFYLAHIANKKFSEKTKYIFMEIGATSFGIYLIHPLFLMAFRALVTGGSPIVFHGWQLFTFFAVGILSWAAVRFTFRYIPFDWVIFGKMAEQQKFPRKKAEEESRSRRVNER